MTGNSRDGWGPQNSHKYWFAGAGVVTCFDARKEYLPDEFLATFPVPCRDIPWQ
jgi:hypothetical protein